MLVQVKPGKLAKDRIGEVKSGVFRLGQVMPCKARLGLVSSG
jgi:hypothetical protein